jgi:hypothetical protein
MHLRSRGLACVDSDHPLFDVEVDRSIIRTSKRTSVSARNPGMVGEAHVNQRFWPQRVRALLRKVLVFDFFGRLTRPEIGRIHQFGIDEPRMRKRPGMTVSARRPIFSRQMVRARASVDANRPRRPSKAREGSLCERPPILAAARAEKSTRPQHKSASARGSC